jgi:hypothetical protein
LTKVGRSRGCALISARETKRKQYASELFHLTAAEIAEEEALYVEIKRMEQNERRYRADRDDLMRTVVGLDSGLIGLDQANGEGVVGLDKVSEAGGVADDRTRSGNEKRRCRRRRRPRSRKNRRLMTLRIVSIVCRRLRAAQRRRTSPPGIRSTSACT